MKRVIAKVVSGKCNQRFHRVGDTFVIGQRTPDGMCTSAFNAVFPLVFALQCGGKLFWEDDPHVTYASCPDDTGLVFQIKLAPAPRKRTGKAGGKGKKRGRRPAKR
ncbi:MAG: TIGR04076 family protein [bacterium]